MYHYISEFCGRGHLPARSDRDAGPVRGAVAVSQAQGYQNVSLVDIYETLTLGKPLPPRPIVLTFDDGYKDAYTHALPLLQTYGFTGEFFRPGDAGTLRRRRT